VGWGNYQGDANGVAASAIGVLCRGCFSFGDRITVDGSVGAGWSEFKTYGSGNVVAGRGGVSWGLVSCQPESPARRQACCDSMQAALLEFDTDRSGQLGRGLWSRKR
jgi:hypothetical protein